MATTANGPSSVPSLSADGAYVTFHSSATNPVTSQSSGNPEYDAFLYDRATGGLTLVSHTPAGLSAGGNGESKTPRMSADGAYVTFVSRATDLVAGQIDTNANVDLFRYTRATGAVTLVSHAATGAATAGNGPVLDWSVSADGRYIAFVSRAGNLVAGMDDASAVENMILHDTATGLATLVSHVPTDPLKAAGGVEYAPSISADGTFVAFGSSSTSLVTGQIDSNGEFDVFLFQRTGKAAAAADFDGNARTDISVFRPSTGEWLVPGRPTVYVGAANDVPVPSDYDSDGDTDAAVFRPAVGGWYVDGQSPVFFGLPGDVPVPGDYDGNGDADVAVFRRAVGGWYVDGQATQVLGLSTDIPQPGDYDGNGTTDCAVYRPSTGAWYVGGADPVFFGGGGDVPLPLPSAIRLAAFP